MPNIPRYEITAEEFDLIESYLLHQLPEEEQLHFQQRLAQDDMLRAKVNEVRNLVTGIEETLLEKKLPGYHTTALEEKAETPVPSIPSGTTPLYRRWWVAAAVLLIVAGTWIFWPRASRDERLFATYYVPDAGLPVAMGSADSTSYVFYDGMVSYKEGNYAAALTRWQSLENTPGAKDTLHYYEAMAHLNLGNHAQATALLIPLAKNETSLMRDDALWFMALIDLKNGNHAEAIKKLQPLKDREEARKLLSELEDQ